MFNTNKEYNITYDANGDIVRDSSASVDPNFTGQKNNLLGTTAPNSTNDSSDGYSVGSRWVFGAEIYMCVSSVDTAAIWQRCVLVEYEQESIYLTGSVVSFENSIYRASEYIPATEFFDDSKWVRILDGGDYDSELILTDPIDAAEGDLKFINYDGASNEIIFSREFNRTFLFRNYSNHEVKLYIKDGSGGHDDSEGMMIACKGKFSMRIALEGGKILWTNGDNALIDDVVLAETIALYKADLTAAITAIEVLYNQIDIDYNTKNISAFESWKSMYGNPDTTEAEFVDSIVSAFRHGDTLPPASGSQTIFFDFVEGKMFIDIFDDVTGYPKWELWINSSTTSFELDVAISLTNLTREVLTNSNNNADLLVRVTNLENA